jgi:hypothetical protein
LAVFDSFWGFGMSKTPKLGRYPNPIPPNLHDVSLHRF